MRGISLIYKREIGQYFASPIAYLIAFAFLLLTALVFNNDLTVSLGEKPADPSIIPQFLAFGMVFFAPLLTMRMLAEESREGTLELLLTAPVREGAIVLGKFFSAWTYYTILLLATLLYQRLLPNTAATDLGHLIASYMGIWLYGGATLAVGLMFSSMTENQIIAAFLSLSVLLLMYLGDLAGEIVSSVDLANLIRKMTLQGHFSTSFAFGFMRLEDVAFFAGIMTVTLFITIRVVESHRWRG